MKATLSPFPFKEWDIIRQASNNQYSIVYSIDQSTEHSCTIDMKVLNISKYWLIRKIQIWALKKSFK